MNSQKMKTIRSQKIAEYKFQDSQRIVYSIPVGHLLLVIAFTLPGASTIFTNPFALSYGLTAILFFVSIKLNSWQSHHFNLLLIFVYILIFFGEWILFGIPTSLITSNQTFSVSKGVLLQIISDMMPYIYVGMRLFLVIPLIQMTISSNQLKKS